MVDEVIIPIDDPELLGELDNSFFQGPMLDENGTRYLIEVTVAHVGPVAVEIRLREHPPPHFHVTFGDEDARFSIIDCQRLPGVRGLERYENNIKVWWKKNRDKLITKWNETRPSDCPVGPINLRPAAEAQ